VSFGFAPPFPPSVVCVDKQQRRQTHMHSGTHSTRRTHILEGLHGVFEVLLVPCLLHFPVVSLPQAQVGALHRRGQLRLEQASDRLDGVFCCIEICNPARSAGGLKDDSEEFS
jgi:hypothetical protein